MIRLFIALPINSDLQQQITNKINDLRKCGADVKWVEQHNLHLTIKFLGEQPPEAVPDFISALERAAGQVSRFSLNLNQIGYFPGRNRPRTIWLGLGGELDLANRLAKAIDDELQNIAGIAPEKNRRWHLTLGRVRSERNLEVLQPQLEPSFKSLQDQGWELDSFTLYQSTLTPKGPIYEAIKHFTLQ